MAGSYSCRSSERLSDAQFRDLGAKLGCEVAELGKQQDQQKYWYRFELNSPITQKDFDVLRGAGLVVPLNKRQVDAVLAMGLKLEELPIIY